MHHTRRRMRHRPALLVGFALFAGLALISGCDAARPNEPLRDSREALGTIVTITAYGDDGAKMQRFADEAFEAIATTESELSAYPDVAANPAQADTALPSYEVASIAQFNRDPFEWHELPASAAHALERVARLGVSDSFSPGMLRVIQLYDFDGEGTVPDPAELARLVRAAGAFETSAGSTVGRFRPVGEVLAPPDPPYSSYAPPAAGLDFSGATKGAALDGALDVFERGIASGAIEGAILSAGSTTIVVGSKSPHSSGGAEPEQSEPWQIGIEDPRDPDRVIGIVRYSLAGRTLPGGRDAFGLVSTSGDYQQSFTRDGVLYHHILDPATGEPARAIRSLTVVGGESGLDSDILSTALFVMGIDRAEAYAREHGLGLFIVDEAGRTRIVPGPKGAPFSIEESAR